MDKNIMDSFQAFVGYRFSNMISVEVLTVFQIVYIEIEEKISSEDKHCKKTKPFQVYLSHF